ncbi:hypothetical protein LCGC14_1676350 [marine sediment metagenome]|uniref:Uncharacterized protein n=1 Tax=marine sediment metagenome TaxID=412755 RepID=A0A0F9HQH2_9ZZZZ
MSELAEIIVNFIMEGMIRYGALVWMLAILGIVSIISAIGNKAFTSIKYVFMIFIAIPCIFVVGLINKSNRKERMKELGEIAAHFKQKPENWKRMLYYFLWCLFVIFIVLIGYYFVKKFILPFAFLNEFSKQILQNSSNSTI